MTSIPELLLTGGATSIVVSAGNWFVNRKKGRAEVGDLTTTTSAKLVQMSSEYAEKVDARLEKVNEKLEIQGDQIVELKGVIEAQRDEHVRQLAAKDEHIAQIEETARDLQRQVTRLKRALLRRGIQPDDIEDDIEEGEEQPPVSLTKNPTGERQLSLPEPSGNH